MATQTIERQPVQAYPSTYRWTRQKYEQAIEAGIFQEDDRVELIDGEIIEMSPQRSLHATGVMMTAAALRNVFSDNHHVRPQLPLSLDPDSEPEPDIAVVEGALHEYRDAHPKTAVLVVEVSDTSLLIDRTLKAALYARHGIPEYWIVNLPDDCLEVYRDPSGDTYQTKTTLHRGDTVTPAQVEQTVAVIDLLP